MGTSTKIHKRIGVAVGGDDPVFRAGGRVICFAVEDFQLVGMICEQRVRFFALNFSSDKRLFVTDDFFHFGGNAFQVVVAKGLVIGKIEVVVEAVLYRRSDAKGRPWVELQYGLGEHMSC